MEAVDSLLCELLYICAAQAVVMSNAAVVFTSPWAGWRTWGHTTAVLDHLLTLLVVVGHVLVDAGEVCQVDHV